MYAKNFIRFSLIIAIFTLLILILLASFLEPRLTEISKINKKMLDEYIKIRGYVNTRNVINSQDEMIILKIEDQTGEIETIFRNKIDLKYNQKIEVIGKVSEYKGKIQIEASKIRILE